MLRDNLTSSQEGYDYVDLRRLDGLAKKIAGLEGEYAEGMALLAREERGIRRRLVRATSPAETEECNRQLQALAFDAEDLHEAAEVVDVELQVEDGDYKLIADKLDNVSRWLALEGIRHVVIGMVEAVRNAELEGGEDISGEIPRAIRRR